jgi:hypothetical protein
MEMSIGSYKFRVEILILIIVVFWVMAGHMLCSCCLFRIEGFSGANKSSMSPEFATSKSQGYIMNPSTWSMPTLTYSPGTTSSAGVKSILDRKKQPIPLPKGELDMFATTPFKPECCPNTYSASMGCACMTVDQYNYLINRGGNNVPFSEY